MGKKLVRATVFLLAFLFAAYAIIQFGFFSPRKAGLVSFKLRSSDFHLEPWIYILYIHIVTGVLALVIGPFNLFRSPLHEKTRRRHRLMGYVYVGAITVSGLVNLYLSCFATGGWVAGLGFAMLDICWMLTTWYSVLLISRNDMQGHRRWMLRSYALTFAAVTLRLWLPILLLLFGGDFILAYQIVSWLCWMGNLLVIEAVIRWRFRQSKLEPWT
ncbi:DUF2306 domain-containing protein [Brevibacillus sp. GCM10020057]|uniref:DUF2306 domain-containing protein n=1 Tax=Brevibacillus sp. GCM10020057 TaxID=3317327 RepID=UPI0036265575